MEDVFIATALIDKYCKAGKFRSVREVFRKIGNKKLASWNMPYLATEKRRLLFLTKCAMQVSSQML
ncbi:hypothetical protein L484_017592 [Morus notabilis]|uniref:Pentatricopeptide repeat-containing protein n=1 Tax=Morus notabilis TaxID=981085 RepID=W9R825_9ROSA|nr:hypothetical protein L484_017592 [Morus notabilis]